MAVGGNALYSPCDAADSKPITAMPFSKMVWPTATILQGIAKKSLIISNKSSTEVVNKIEQKDVKETRAVIIDIGTRSCKIGYAGEPKPSFVVSSTLGIPLRETSKTGDNWKEHFIGNEKET
ncbi:unnamed protein product [Ranitomeya imitator]|uniref:Uncharacterized protein n=1 Tax=Ranitomeya imitator TaxID=111125 RepID=A0ABN9M1C7_9NEOB|nr:unnamed protein product [Ranitomeya imitator]